MKRTAIVIRTGLSVFFILVQSFVMSYAQTTGHKGIIGRWDLTVDMSGKSVPSWLEVKQSGIKTLVGHFVAHNGSARPISKINFTNGRLQFSIPPQWDDSDMDMSFEAAILDGKMEGTIMSSLGEKHTLTGEKAPLLKRSAPPVWNPAVKIFNGKDLAGWRTDEGKSNWVVENGVLKNTKGGANLITEAKYKDFKLHIEFRYPKGSNSGVYLRGRYEVQIQDDMGMEPSSVNFGGIYGFLTPNIMAAKAPGEWQSYDITLVGRTVTVVANGKTIISEQLIPGITGGALDSKEGEPGPLMLQGDHGPVEFRNIMITTAK